jgi:hypothetical protein
VCALQDDFHFDSLTLTLLNEGAVIADDAAAVDNNITVAPTAAPAAATDATAAATELPVTGTTVTEPTVAAPTVAVATAQPFKDAAAPPIEVVSGAGAAVRTASGVVLSLAVAVLAAL